MEAGVTGPNILDLVHDICARRNLAEHRVAQELPDGALKSRNALSATLMKNLRRTRMRIVGAPWQPCICCSSDLPLLVTDLHARSARDRPSASCPGSKPPPWIMKPSITGGKWCCRSGRRARTAGSYGCRGAFRPVDVEGEFAVIGGEFDVCHEVPISFPDEQGDFSMVTVVCGTF